MTRERVLRDYCGAPPPEGKRRTATCILTAGHATDEHRNLDGDRWTDPETVWCPSCDADRAVQGEEPRTHKGTTYTVALLACGHEVGQ